MSMFMGNYDAISIVKFSAMIGHNINTLYRDIACLPLFKQRLDSNVPVDHTYFIDF